MNSIFSLREALKIGGRLGALFLMGASTVAASVAPHVLPDGVLPKDVRLGPLRVYDGEHTFVPPKTKAEWTARAERVRRQVLVSLGLWPMPTKTPLNVVITGKIDRPDYTVEKVYFESVPGFYVAGNLYRPKGKSGRMPAVLCPYGHWPEGRFTDSGASGVLDQIAEGAERFEEGGRSFLQARCVQLARMGCVVFIYDMIGFGDTNQIPHDLAHTSGGLVKSRPAMNQLENWGFYSAQAEAHLESIMGLQTWDSIRAVDFLLSLPEVDPERIGCVGESGGGTQTLFLAATDDRLKVAFPAVKVSAAPGNDCTCEMASDLKIGTDNVEIAALFAPKPLGMTAANDDTKDMPTQGLPELRRIYQFWGAGNSVMLATFPQFEHNFNSVSRMAMYPWFNEHFNLGLAEPIVENDYRRLTREEATVWDADHPAPSGGPDFERQLLRTLTADAAKQLGALASEPDKYRSMVSSAVDVLIGRNLDEVGQIEWVPKHQQELAGYTEAIGLLRNVTHQEELPLVFLKPERWNGEAVIWLERDGKSCLYADGPTVQLKPEVQALIDQGCAVIGADLFLQGEFVAYGGQVERTRSVDTYLQHHVDAPAYTFCCNSSLFAQRVHDILTTVKFAQALGGKNGKLVVVGLNGAGPLVAAAVPQSRGAITGAVIVTGGFRFSSVRDVHDVNFLPGGAKYGDLPGMIALAGSTHVIQLDAPARPLASALQELLQSPPADAWPPVVSP